jgi:hypothetical protein
MQAESRHLKRILAMLLAFACLASAEEQTIHWSDLGRLISGREVVVRLQNGKRVKGSAVAAGMDSIRVRTSGGETSIDRRSIREIRLTKRAGYKWRVIGTAIGAGAGLAAAIPVLTETHNEGSGSYDGAAVGLIAGLALAGFLGGWSVDRSSDVIHILPD